MATDIIQSLFWPMPYEIDAARRQQDEAYATKLAGMNNIQQAKLGIGQGAAGLGRMLGGAMGMVDPMQDEAQARMNALSGIDLSNSQSIAQAALRTQDPRLKAQLGLMAAQQRAKEQESALKHAQELAALRKASAEASPLGKIDPSKYTQESVREWYQGGMRDPSVLVAIEKSEKDPTSYREWVLAGKPGTYDDWLMRNKKAGATSVTNVIPGAKDLKDIPKFRKDVQDTVKPQMETVYASDKALAALDLAIKENNPSAFQVARTQLAKAAGDSQISLREIEAAGGDPSLAGKIMDTGSVLFTGTPTIDTQMNMKRTLKAIAKVAKEKGRAEISAQRTIAERSGYGKEDLDAALKFDAFNESAVGVGQTVKLKSGKTVKRID